MQAGVVGLGVFGASVASAATTTYTVNSTNSSAAAVACANAPDAANRSCGTLRDALTEANALAASPGDDIRVQFAPGVAGDIQYTNTNQRMLVGGFGVNHLISGNEVPQGGAVFHINARRPLTLDFGSRVNAVVLDNTLATAQLYVASSGVTVENFDAPGGLGINAARTGLVIGNVQNTVIRNGRNQTTINAGIKVLDYCMALIDGASGVTVTNYTCDGGEVSGFYVDQLARVSNVSLSNVIFRNVTAGGVDKADINIDHAASVVVMEVASAAFSSPVENTIVFDSEFGNNDRTTTVTNFTVRNSTFTGANAIGVLINDLRSLDDRVVTTNLTVRDNTFTNTAEMVRFSSNIRTAQSGTTITNNTMNAPSCSSDPCGLIHMPGPDPVGNASASLYSNTLISGNQFLNQQAGANRAGVYIRARGTNNVISNNVFNGDTTDAAAKDLFAVYSEAANNGGSTGWTVNSNTIKSYVKAGPLRAPIFLNGAGDTIAFGNTFGVNSTGAAAGVLTPESGSTMFVANNDGGANGQIQAWRPTGGFFGGNTVTVTISPVSPAAGGILPAGGGNSNTAPVNPVFIDVYHSATDKAETYLGRIPGTYSSATTHTFLNAGVGAGVVRTQVTDASGQSSQYSASFQLLPDAGLVARGVGAGALGGLMLALLGGLALLRRRVLAPVLGLLALATAFNASAGDWTDKFYGGGQFGYLRTDFDAQKLKNNLNAKPGYAVSDVQVDHNGIGGGLWLGYALNQCWGAEFSWTTGADEKVRFAGSVPSLEQAVNDASPDLIGYGDAYQLRLRYNHMLGKDWVLSPHAGIGVTWTNQSFESGLTGQQAKLDDISFSYSVGGSLNYVINRDWSVGLTGDFHQVPGNGRFGLVGVALEWRMPRAFGIR